MSHTYYHKRKKKMKFMACKKQNTNHFLIKQIEKDNSVSKVSVSHLEPVSKGRFNAWFTNINVIHKLNEQTEKEHAVGHNHDDTRILTNPHISL